MNNPELREKTAVQLQAAVNRASQMTAFVGLDGFVDDILHVVDKRESAEKVRSTSDDCAVRGASRRCRRSEHQRGAGQPIDEVRRQWSDYG